MECPPNMTAWDAIRVVFCVYLVMSRRVQEIQANEMQTCSCVGGCNASTPCDPNTICNKENVAYDKEATMSSRYSGGGGLSGPACAAVNGRTGDKMKYVNESGTNCVHTLGNANDWWQVDLGQNYTVTDIIIYSREYQASRLAGIRITIDNKECFTLPSYTDDYSRIHTVTCNTSPTGQIVKLSKVNGITEADKRIISICEVQIWVCKPGLFGPSCSQQCSGHCQHTVTCDNHYGTCPNGCMDFYYGASCSERCGQCVQGDACSGTNGHCPDGCGAGYKPPLCNKSCENKTYGENCREQCGRCENSAACNIFNGSCQACEGHFALPFCTECMDGHHGNECRERCGQCADNDMCDKVTGRCPSGCQTGYQPPYCNTNCEGNTYGQDCEEECGLCSNLKPCNVFNGTCDACYKELTLPMCKDHSETSDAGSLAGPIAGAVVGGFCLLGLSVLVVGLFLRRAWSARSAEQVQSTTGTETTETNYEEQPAVEMTPSTETNVDVTVGERGDYESLQNGTDDRFPYDTPVFAKQNDVYENADLDTNKDNAYYNLSS